MADVLSITGRLTAILPKAEGEGQNGHWVRQPFVLEVKEGNFVTNVCFDAWGDTTGVLAAFNLNDMLSVSFRPSSREYNGRWYTSLRAWRIVSAPAEGTAATQSTSDGVDPASTIPHVDTTPTETEEDIPHTRRGENGEELPF